VPDATRAGPPSFAALATRLLPSVVSVIDLDAGSAMVGHEAGRAPKTTAGEAPGASLGAGFVVDERGHVVTNRHVLGPAARIRVQLADGRELGARLVGHDAQTDLAVLRVEGGGEKLPALALGDSDRLLVGDWVLAVGSPFGLGHSLSAGIVSAKGRRDLLEPAVGYWNFIQTDAAINPGNSGGPLVDLDGRVVGISTAMRSDAHGIAFAIPVNTLKAVLPSLIEKGRVARSWIGIFIDPVTEEVAAKQGLPKARGAVVSRLVEGGPAERADLREGDVITAFDGRNLDGPDDLPWLVSTVAVGRTVGMRIWRDGTERELKVKTTEKPADAP